MGLSFKIQNSELRIRVGRAIPIGLVDGEGNQFDTVRQLRCDALEKDSARFSAVGMMSSSHGTSMLRWRWSTSVDDVRVEDRLEVFHIDEIAAVGVRARPRTEASMT